MVGRSVDCEVVWSTLHSVAVDAVDAVGAIINTGAGNLYRRAFVRPTLPPVVSPPFGHLGLCPIAVVS